MLGELEREATLLVKRILHGLHMVRPREAVAVKCVVDGVVGGDGVRDSVGGFGSGEGESAASGRGVDGVEVEADLTVEVVDVDATVAVKFRDFEVGMRAEEILKGFIEAMEPCE